MHQVRINDGRFSVSTEINAYRKMVANKMCQHKCLNDMPLTYLSISVPLGYESQCHYFHRNAHNNGLCLCAYVSRYTEAMLPNCVFSIQSATVSFHRNHPINIIIKMDLDLKVSAREKTVETIKFQITNDEYLKNHYQFCLIMVGTLFVWFSLLFSAHWTVFNYFADYNY